VPRGFQIARPSFVGAFSPLCRKTPDAVTAKKLQQATKNQQIADKLKALAWD
jgi:hypothetical protein